MRVSVVIPTKNEENYIGNCLNYLSRQTYNDYEILVVDAHSTDNTVKIAEEYGAKIIFEEKGKGGYGYARNLGVERAKNKIICFLDADIYLIDKYSLERAVNSLNEYNVDGVFSKLTFPKTPLGIYLSRPFEQPTQIITKYTTRPPLCLDFSVWWKKTITNVLFDENFKVSAEDQDFYYRLFKISGSKVLYNSEIVVYHCIDTNIDFQVERAYKFGKGVRLLYDKYGIGDEGFKSPLYVFKAIVASVYSCVDCVRRIGLKALPILVYNYKLMMARRRGFIEGYE